MAVLAVLAAPRPLPAQTTAPFQDTPEAHYFDFWPGTWVEVVDGVADTSATRFVVRRSVHPAAYEERWRLVVDGDALHATALRAWDRVAGRWRFAWVSDNGLYQVWEGRKFGDVWYIVRAFEIDGEAFLSRQAWIPRGPDELVRVMERSFDDGRTWEPRSRTVFRRVEPTPARSRESEAEPMVLAGDPGVAFGEVERRLLEGASRIAFGITADGAFAADLVGTLVLGDGAAATLEADGTFGDDPVVLRLRADDARLVGGNDAEGFDQPVPAGLRDALVIGLTRMGLLHNLARLVSGAPPDRADGDVRAWVQAGEFAWVDPDDGSYAARGIAFAIMVSGQRTADAVLWLDDRGLPVARDQTVRFPGGEMRVREEYEVRPRAAAEPGSASSAERPTYVVVHGAWGGAWDWRTVDSLLTAAGHRVHRVQLTGLGERVHLASPDIGLDTHVEDVVNTILWEELTGVVLIGHSYGGMVITGVADRVPGRIRELVYLDALLPRSGESLLDLFGDGAGVMLSGARDGFLHPMWVPADAPVPRDVPQPLKTFTDTLRLTGAGHDVPGTYILTVAPDATTPDDFQPFADRAAQRGWPVIRMDADHVPERSAPDALVKVLLSLL